MPRQGERQVENHPWRGKAMGAARMKELRETADKNKREHASRGPWSCPNCGECDCNKSCDGSDF